MLSCKAGIKILLEDISLSLADIGQTSTLVSYEEAYEIMHKYEDLIAEIVKKLKSLQ